MTSSYASLRALFDECADLPDGERLAWLERHVPDTTQRIELELMLAADQHDAGFFGRDVVSHIGHFGEAEVAEFRPENLVGRRFGAFELKRLLGQGGQGTVYLAERSENDFQQTAAVKLLRRGIHDATEHRRFRRERGILARFEHPGVSRLIDGGVSPEGVPYLVMEYVDGVTIERWCRDQKLSTEARVRLFSDLCRVVAMAHRSLIVHRDLKPSNVLVAANGAIKVLDFGIARLLDEDESDTESQYRVMTPGYGAPEQKAGGTITPATDVYALGVVLRVLLTDKAPAEQTESTTHDSVAALPLDLRAIIDKACATEAELRYRDATELDDDVHRYLENRPVLAHPPSRWYRVRRFSQRHRGSILVTALVIVGILTSLGMALWQTKVAREQAQRAESTRDFLLGVFEAARDDLPRDARPTPDNLVRAAAKRLEADTTLNPLSRADFFAALAEISHSSNEHEQALEYAGRALALLDSQGQSNSRAHVATEAIRANALIRLGRAEEADKALGARLAAIRAEVDEVALEGLSAYAMARIATGHLDDGIAITREAIGVAEAYGHDERNLLSMRLSYGFALGTAGRMPEGMEVLQDTLKRWKASGAPPDATYATVLNNLAAFKAKSGHSEEAIGLMREALQVRRDIFDAPHEKIANALQNLGVVLGDRGEYEESEKLLAESAAMYAARFGAAHAQSISAVNAQARLDARRGRPERALEALLRNASTCAQPELAKEPTCMHAFVALADTYLLLDRVDAASAASGRGLELCRALFGEQHPEYAAALIPRIDILLRSDDPTAALAAADQALGILRAGGQDQTLNAAGAMRLKATALHAFERNDEALEAIDAARTITERLAPRDNGRRFAMLALRAELLSALGREADARAAAREALALPQTGRSLKPERRQRLEAIAR